jgi:DNA-binding transcriptional LysR family regulator
MCRMAEAGVGIGVVPESAAIRHVQTMQIALIKIDEPWAVLKRYVLVRELDALPRAAQALVAELVARQIGGMSAGKQEAG